jgi:hypothetical protein
VRIAPQGQNTRNVVTFEVKIEVTDDDKDLLRPEMTASVQIVEATRHNVVLAPMLSLFDRDDKTYVTIARQKNATEDRVVQVGIDDGDNAEIVSGLSAGDKIMVHHNDAASKWTGTRGKSAGAVSKRDAAKQTAAAAKKQSKSTGGDFSSEAKKKQDKDAARTAAKKSAHNKKTDDSSDDDNDQ